MDMNGMPTMPAGNGTMAPYLHFTSGDYLLFEAWRPSSTGAIAGACIGLAILAIVDRWVAAIRRILDESWRNKALALVSRVHTHPERSPSAFSNAASEKSLSGDLDTQYVLNASATLSTSHQSLLRPPRIIPPFILAHDIPRGIIHTIQALMLYALMLSVMTFNAAYIISVILGLGIGETIFARMGNGRSIMH